MRRETKKNYTILAWGCGVVCLCYVKVMGILKVRRQNCTVQYVRRRRPSTLFCPKHKRIYLSESNTLKNPDLTTTTVVSNSTVQRNPGFFPSFPSSAARVHVHGSVHGHHTHTHTHTPSKRRASATVRAFEGARRARDLQYGPARTGRGQYSTAKAPRFHGR